MSADKPSIFNEPVTRRQAVKTIGTTVAAGLVGLNFPGIVSARGRMPNVIFILTDDHRWDAFSCMDHPFLKTPNLDRIAGGRCDVRKQFLHDFSVQSIQSQFPYRAVRAYPRSKDQPYSLG